MSAQFFEAALELGKFLQIETGNFNTLHDWLKANIYQHGRKYTAAELVERVTGAPLSIDPFIRYIQRKYGTIRA